MQFAYLAIALTLNSVANILLKKGASSGGISNIAALLQNYYFLGGVALFALNVIFYFLALRAIPLSTAYPIMVATSFLLVNGYAHWFLAERVNAFQLAGYTLVVAGILCVFYFADRP
jgi:multidrug transporter EmrE-like cation transporter